MRRFKAKHIIAALALSAVVAGCTTYDLKADPPSPRATIYSLVMLRNKALLGCNEAFRAELIDKAGHRDCVTRIDGVNVIIGEAIVALNDGDEDAAQGKAIEAKRKLDAIKSEVLK